MASEIYRKILLHNVKVAETDDQPGGERQQRNQKDEGNKESAKSVGELLNGRLSRDELNGHSLCRIM